MRTLAAAAVLVASSTGGPPPAPQVSFGVAHTRPVVGHIFTGLAVTPAAASISGLSCDATIKGATLRARQQRFYADEVDGPAAVSCAWKIPARARGLLTVHATVYTGTGGTAATSASWRIRR